MAGANTFSVTFDVAAVPARVWSVMADIERWPEWTASVSRIERLDGGLLRVDSRLRIHQPRLPPALWIVESIDEGVSVVLVTRGPGVSVVARHRIEATNAGSRVTLRIDFEGWLAPLFARLTRRLNERYLAMEAEGLKRRSEA
jgi:carbon monoxide dehydrogenase subunit G